ncbi:MAG: hypothetical protein M3Y27_14635 [Acidobacteriota bacterium]|nr:hypothetical protein [Acidobacteriota bacterium]
MNTATRWEGSAFRGEGNKGGDTRTVGETTAAGAAAGLARVLSSRGADVLLRPGTTTELTLDRDLQFSAAELRLGVQ